MASGWYTNFDNLCLGGGVHTLPNLTADLIKVAIVSGADYTEDLANDQDYDDVGLYAINTCYNSEPTITLTNGNTTISGGIWDNTDTPTYTSVAIDGVKVVDALIHYYDSTIITTSTLICFHDGFTAVTPNGGDIQVAYNASGIAEL